MLLRSRVGAGRAGERSFDALRYERKHDTRASPEFSDESNEISLNEHLISLRSPYDHSGPGTRVHRTFYEITQGLQQVPYAQHNLQRDADGFSFRGNWVSAAI